MKEIFAWVAHKSAKYTAVALILVFSFGCASGCAVSPVPSEGESTTVEKAETVDINDVTIQDNDFVYAFDDEDSVVTMYLTVRKGNEAEDTYHTWSEINGYSIFDYEVMGVERYKVEAILQVGDENGPVAGELGYGLTIPNAIVQIRGNTTSKAAQKSYKIELKSDAGTWQEQKTIALNKHIYDGLRFRNKLCYDLIKDIPDMISLRTQFVHLYVKDTTGDIPDTEFVDYGLFTQVEQPNTTFLRNHGLDTGGQFYKANFFEYYRYEDTIKLTSDPDYDEGAFEEILEIKGDDDHAKLIAMLYDLNDYTIPIEETFEKYFDETNYFTWLAFNILTGNVDTQSRNYYLYSPLNSNTWYFIDWDCDGAFFRQEDSLLNPEEDAQDLGYEIGISNYWGDVLHNRVLRVAKYREMLDDKINELRKYLSADRLNTMVGTYREVVEPYVYSMPDNMNARLTQAEYDQIADSLYAEVEQNYQHYLESLENPMPFYMANPEVQDAGLYFVWDPAYSLKSQDITYSFELARDYLLEDVIYTEERLGFPTITVDKLQAGQYFFRVYATDEDGQTQCAMAYYVDSDRIKHFGVQCFYVLEDGKVVAYEAS